MSGKNLDANTESPEESVGSLELVSKTGVAKEKKPLDPSIKSPMYFNLFRESPEESVGTWESVNKPPALAEKKIATFMAEEKEPAPALPDLNRTPPPSYEKLDGANKETRQYRTLPFPTFQVLSRFSGNVQSSPWILSPVEINLVDDNVHSSPWIIRPVEGDIFIDKCEKEPPSCANKQTWKDAPVQEIGETSRSTKKRKASEGGFGIVRTAKKIFGKFGLLKKVAPADEKDEPVEEDN